MTLFSELCLHDLARGTTQVILRLPRRIEAPNLSPCGTWVLVNGDGQLFRVDLDSPALIPLDMGGITRANNDHGFSADGKTIYFSAHHRGLGAEIYKMPASGGAAQPFDIAPRSWWHGVSRDDALVYAGARGDGRSVNIYRHQDGHEAQLTQDLGHCDGPDVSADGRWIYFNSDATGHAQIWVMGQDGAGARPLFEDSSVNWFPHPSPDGRHLIYLSYPAGTTGHPRDLPVQIILCKPDGTDRRCIAEFIGGQGTMNVPNWAADSACFAFVRYDPGQV